MYYQNYEDYMRYVLGYPRENQNTYEEVNKENSQYMQDISKLETYYPDVYRKIDPIVEETCLRCTKSLEKEDLETMVDEIYNKVESNNEIIANMGNNQNREVRQRRPNNNLLRDLIKILILDKFKFRRPNPRPPYPNDFRPPMPPVPPRPGYMDNYLRF